MAHFWLWLLGRIFQGIFKRENGPLRPSGKRHVKVRNDRLNQGRASPAFSKPCLCLSDARHFPSFWSFSGVWGATPLFSVGRMQIRNFRRFRQSGPAPFPQRPSHIKNYYGHINSLRWWQKNTTVVKQYGSVSETPCFPGEIHRRKSPCKHSELLRRSCELIRCSIFNTAGSFGFGRGQKQGFHKNTVWATTS